jgi:hypothetical protein
MSSTTLHIQIDRSTYTRHFSFLISKKGPQLSTKMKAERAMEFTIHHCCMVHVEQGIGALSKALAVS